jgi:hypothetical protein
LEHRQRGPNVYTPATACNDLRKSWLRGDEPESCRFGELPDAGFVPVIYMPTRDAVPAELALDPEARRFGEHPSFLIYWLV